MYRNFYSYSDMPHISKPENKKNTPSTCEKPVGVLQNPNEKKNILGNLQTDDIILIAVVLILFVDDCDDSLLLLALAVIFGLS